MILAAYRDDAYNVVLVLHIIAVVMAFAPIVMAPFLAKPGDAGGADPGARAVATFMSAYITKVTMGALVVALLTGIGMIVMSDDVIEFSAVWISVAFLVWFALAGVISAVVGKGLRLGSQGDTSGAKSMALGINIVLALVVVMVYLMVFKPGA